MTAATESWGTYLASRFIGYLLPASAARRLEEAEARRFLQRLTSRPNALELLRSTAALAPHAERLSTFADRLLPDLLRVLPARNTVITRRWEGGYHGRLDIRRTTGERLCGSASTFVTSARRRDHSLPENVLVREVIDRLLSEVANLHDAGVLSTSGWGTAYLSHEPGLRRVLGFSRLCDVASELITAHHLQAARTARHPCYREALWWWQLLDESRTRDPERLARLVAGSALAPLAPETRFELAVLARLIESLSSRLTPSAGWELEHSLLLPNRSEVVRLTSEAGWVLRVFYNQCELPPGPADLGARHYLGQQGRLRPDITLTIERTGAAVRAHVFEVKLSADPGYVLSGLHEAMLYASEYRAALSGWPRAALVVSSDVPGAPRREDPVIAVDWEHWVPAEVVDGLVEELPSPRPQRGP